MGQGEEVRIPSESILVMQPGPWLREGACGLEAPSSPSWVQHAQTPITQWLPKGFMGSMLSYGA